MPGDGLTIFRGREPGGHCVLPHYYEFGSNVFQGLSHWGVEFIGAQQPPGQPYRTAWIM